MEMSNSPIAIFAFKRPDHLTRALASLSRCPEFFESHVRIYCDGPRNDGERGLTERVAEIAHGLRHPCKEVVAYSENQGLAKSISTGVSDLCRAFGRTIVIEDDLTVSPVYLTYMNDALDRYAHCQKVMQVAGHVFPARFRTKNDAVMLPVSSTWGWGTWQRAWSLYDPEMAHRGIFERDPELRRRFDLEGAYPYYGMLQDQLANKVDSWGIKWYLSFFVAEGLCVFPTQTLVIHELDGTGTHCKLPQYQDRSLREVAIRRWPDPVPDPNALADFQRFIRSDRRLWRKVLRLLRSKLAAAKLFDAHRTAL